MHLAITAGSFAKWPKPRSSREAAQRGKGWTSQQTLLGNLNMVL
jgi:hypothetical protein